LIGVNSGYGIQFNASTNRSQQSLAVIDLEGKPEPKVIQNLYFPSPQSAQVGVVFDPEPDDSGRYTLYVSGGVENRIWIFQFLPGEPQPLSPPSPGPDTEVTAPSFSIAGFANAASSPRYNRDLEPVYPLGLALDDEARTLFVANNLSDNLGIVRDLAGSRRLDRVDLRGSNKEELIYPYGVVFVPASGSRRADKVYVSCWGTEEVVVVEVDGGEVSKRISVDRHPTAMTLNADASRLFVVNSNADTVSVIDTDRDEEIERIHVGLTHGETIGSSPESPALSADGATLYVANAHSNAVAVVALSPESRNVEEEELDDEMDEDEGEEDEDRSKVRGFIPAGQYPSAVAVAAGQIFVGNGKGTGFENSSLNVNQTGMAPNAPNPNHPAGPVMVGQYIVSLVSGNISMLDEPDDLTLSQYTQQSMRNAGLVGPERKRLFDGPSPFEHVIYIIKENRTYDQVLGDLEKAGNGQSADGDPYLAIFGAGDAARRPGGPPQNVSPNHHALALRFGLFDRFFVNSEASPDGHNWATAAFSSDYVDKAFRWNYSGRGRTYDFEGFNRLPSTEPRSDLPPVLPPPVTAHDIADHMKQYIPYLQGGRDIAEPETLYLWDAVAQAGLTYRNYGEFIGTISEADVKGYNENRWKDYPDISPNQVAFATKRSLEGHFCPTFRNYDLETPDAMTADSYRSAKQSGNQNVALIAAGHAEERFRGNSRVGEWLEEFRGFVEARESGRGDTLPNFSIVRLSNDHTSGLMPDMPTPQFHMADNDFAIGLLVEAVSKSPYWRDTAIVILEDDAQNGPDHVDAHRSPAFIISAYNRPGELIHEFHNTVSFIRTMELMLGIEPMNQLDATAVPVDIFQNEPDLTPYEAILPDVALDNLMNPPRDAQNAYWIDRTLEQNLVHADMADPGALNEIIWFSVRGPGSPMPHAVQLPAFDAMRAGLASEAEDEYSVIKHMRTILVRR
jgi:YVTN family beta-propeller protein